MCTITGITEAESCVEAIGGIKALYLAEFSSLGFTIASKKVTAVTGALKKFVMIKNATAFANNPGERTSPRLHRYNTEIFAQFGESDEAADALDDLKACCKLVAIVLFENGNVRLFGVQFTSAAKTALEVSAVEMVATSSDLSDVSTAESRTELRLTAQSKNIVRGLNSALTEVVLDALVA